MPVAARLHRERPECLVKPDGWACSISPEDATRKMSQEWSADDIWQTRTQAPSNRFRDRQIGQHHPELERPVAATRRTPPAADTYEIIPVEQWSLRQRGEVTKCVPRTHLEHVRPREVNGDVRGVMHRMHNENLRRCDIHNSRSIPDLFLAEPEGVATRRERPMNLEPQSARAPVAQWR
jgi:hypothetical protein